MSAVRKPRLAARAPNAGAHRLAWWLGANDARIGLLCRTADLVTPALIDRLLSGEVTPSEGLAEDLAAATWGAVLPDDWNAATALGWFDAPQDREIAGRAPAGGERAHG